MLDDVAAMVRSLTGDDTIVECAHMDLSAPTVAEGFAKCVAAGATEVIVHPYFLVPGRHSTADIPRLVEEAARPYPEVRYRVTEPLGLHSNIAQTVLERVREVTQEFAH